MEPWYERACINILEKELVPAQGCTEPIAIAFAAAKARAVLGEFPDTMEMRCSGNIIKNVKSVLIPNSDGMRGIEMAAILGALGGDAAKGLETLNGITESHRRQARELAGTGFFSCKLAKGVANLYIQIKVIKGCHSAEVTVADKHTFISEIRRDGELVFLAEEKPTECDTNSSGIDEGCLSIANILEFADNVDVEKIREILRSQVEKNSAIALEGLTEDYGMRIGKTLIDAFKERERILPIALAAAASDARMSGCALPVVINSGSGNQGITASLPVVQYAKSNEIAEDILYRALAISNLTAIHIKSFIGSLSAFCGAVSAACGAGAAISYLSGGDHEQISNTIINTLAVTSGIICDGAKPSCAAKIAVSVNAALMAHELSARGLVFQNGDGLVQEDVEATIRAIGHVGRVGMRETDIEVLNIMTGETRI